MNDKYLDLEQSKLKELERDFKAKGYNVIVRPGLFQLPTFLQDIPASPDLLATSDKDNVIVEIKSRKSIKSETQLAKLAEAVNSHEKWSFMLVYTNPKTKVPIKSEKASDYSEIVQHISYVKNFSDIYDSEELRKAFFLLLWGIFEASAISALEAENRIIKRRILSSLVRDTTMAGLISRSDNEKLESLIAKRNSISHGDLKVKITSQELRKLIAVCEELIGVHKS